MDLWTLSSEENEKVVNVITTNALPLSFMSGTKAMACIHVGKILQNRKERKQQSVVVYVQHPGHHHTSHSKSLQGGLCE